jgi:hypothetical protein
VLLQESGVERAVVGHQPLAAQPAGVQQQIDRLATEDENLVAAGVEL